jgi:pyruvate,orthophosphate dikinase
VPRELDFARTEHMFFEVDRIKTMREMILASDEKGRRRALRMISCQSKRRF